MTRPDRTATTSVVSRVNVTALLETLQEAGPLSRRQLGERTGLSPATVNRLTAQLLREGLIVRAGNESADRGRPSHLLRFAGESRVVAAASITETGVVAILRDLTGTTVHRRAIDQSSVPVDARQRLDACLQLVDDVLAEAARQGLPCLGVGVSVPGIVSTSEGHVLAATELGWHDVALGELLATRTQLPFVVENDANALAYGEWATGDTRWDTLVAVELGTGIGAGIISGGRLHRGARRVAGEIGFLLTGRPSLQQRFDDVGDLESQLGARALERDAAHLGWSREAGPVTHWLIGKALAGDEATAELADTLFDLVAFAVAALASVIDPDVVVLGGALGAEGEFVCARVAERLVGRIPSPPAVVASRLGSDAALVGAAELIGAKVQRFTYVSS